MLYQGVGGARAMRLMLPLNGEGRSYVGTQTILHRRQPSRVAGSSVDDDTMVSIEVCHDSTKP